MRVIVDRLEGRSVGSFARDEPLRPPIVDLAVSVPIADRLLDVCGVKVTLMAPGLGVLGPDEALDLHEVRSLWKLSATQSRASGRKDRLSLRPPIRCAPCWSRRAPLRLLGLLQQFCP